MYIPRSSTTDGHYGVNKREMLLTTARDTGPPPDGSNSGGTQTWTYIVAAIVGAVVLILLLLSIYSYIRKLKIAGRSPKYVPTKYLKQKWENWKPKGKYANINRNRAELGPDLENNPQTTETSGVDRHTSVRSIISLPAYSSKPKDTEQVIGREGERAGIDSVVELPETAEEEEDRRENEMESLYQIRQARRREIVEREERRRQRREARENNDWNRLQELQRESRARRDQNSLTNLAQNSASNVNLTAEMLIAEHNSRGRDRRVSSVSYAAIGQVRHDGSRIRSNSHDSERSGLLNGAAPMGQHQRNASEATLQTLGGLPQPRYRDRSDSAATTVSTTASSFENVSPPSEPGRPTTARTATSSNFTGGSISDLGEEEVNAGTGMTVTSGSGSDDSPRPPEYDGHDWGDAPEYTEQERIARANSAATTRNRNEDLNRAPSTVSRTDTLSVITPSIYIESATGPNSPVSPINDTIEQVVNTTRPVDST